MMLRNYNQTLGSYTPAFFHINLNFPFYQSRLALYNLKKKDLSTFVHEYIHFLQDISSYSLLNNAYVEGQMPEGQVSGISLSNSFEEER